MVKVGLMSLLKMKHFEEKFKATDIQLIEEDRLLLDDAGGEC